MEYCIQCVDKKSGEIGDFVHEGDFVAISPVFHTLVELFTWISMNGYRTTGIMTEIIKKGEKQSYDA